MGAGPNTSPHRCGEVVSYPFLRRYRLFFITLYRHLQAAVGIRCGSVSTKGCLGQALDNLNSLHTHIDDTQQQIQNIFRIADFFGPIVGVVFDAAFFVYGYLVTFHYPFNGTFSIDYIPVLSIFIQVLQVFITTIFPWE